MPGLPNTSPSRELYGTERGVDISGAGRIDFQYNAAYAGLHGDPHPVVLILRIDLRGH